MSIDFISLQNAVKWNNMIKEAAPVINSEIVEHLVKGTMDAINFAFGDLSEAKVAASPAPTKAVPASRRFLNLDESAANAVAQMLTSVGWRVSIEVIDGENLLVVCRD